MSQCNVAINHTVAFTRAMAGDLSSMRELVVAVPFNASETLTPIRRVNSTMTAFSGLEKYLSGCQATADIETTVGDLRANVRAATQNVLTGWPTDAQVRIAGVTLFAMLPVVLGLSQAMKESALTFGLDVGVVEIAWGAAEPIGSLPPLPTATPQVAVATQRATATPASTRTPAVSTSSTYNYSRALTYSGLVEAAYQSVELALWDSGRRLFVAEGSTSEEREANHEAAVRDIAGDLLDSVNPHLSWMKHNPASPCFQDAYSADRSAAVSYQSAAKHLVNTLTAIEEAYYREWDLYRSSIATGRALQSTLMKNFQGYFADCR